MAGGAGSSGPHRAVAEDAAGTGQDGTTQVDAEGKSGHGLGHSMAMASAEYWPKGPGDRLGWTFLPRAADDRRPANDTKLKKLSKALKEREKNNE